MNTETAGNKTLTPYSCFSAVGDITTLDALHYFAMQCITYAPLPRLA